MKIITIDPSSTLTGYAVFDDGKLADAGLYKPSKSGLDAGQRVSDMLDDFTAMLGQGAHDAAIIEMPLTKQYTKDPKKKSGFAVWAGAAWAFWATARAWPGCRTFPVSNTVWTRGKSKAERQRIAAIMHKGYDPAKDKGKDVSDAIMLGHYWLNQQKKMEIVRAVMRK